MEAPRESPHLKVLLAGAIAAFTVDFLVYPLDTIKTRYQSEQSPRRPPRVNTRNPLRGLYQGIGSVVVATLPAAGVFFLTYETAKSTLGSAMPSMIPQPVIHALASGSAELASCIVLTPAEVVKQNAQVLRESRPGHRGESTSLKALRMVWRSDGQVLSRMRTGYTALIARNLPFTALNFPMFEFLRGRLWRQRDRRKHDPGESLHSRSGPISAGRLQATSGTNAAALIEVGAVTGAAAAMSGVVAAFLTTPTDVVKTRMMLMSDGDARAIGSQTPSRTGQTNGFNVAKAIFQEAGIRGLFRGAALRVAWTALGSGLYLGSYEMAKSLLGEGMPRERAVEYLVA